MPDLSIEYYYVCPSVHHFHKKVKGKTGEYDVTYGYMTTGDYQYGWSCTCPQFKFRKVECKHIKEAEKERCGWNEEAFCGSGEHIKPSDGKCPNCGQPLEVIKVAI